MSEDEGYGLVMPFVVCGSAGGEFQDAAFVAGYAAGHIDAELAMCAAMPQGIPALPGGRYVQTGIVPQLDLVAMKHGYALAASTGPEDAEGWTWVEFNLPDSEESPE